MEKAKNTPIHPNFRKPVKCFDRRTGEHIKTYPSIFKAANGMGQTSQMICKIANANPRVDDTVLRLNPKEFSYRGEYIWIWAELKD